MSAKQLPGSTHLAYVICAEHESWLNLPQALRGHDGRECVEVSASTGPGGAVRWEFAFVQLDLDGDPAIKLEMFEDAWAAFEEVPELFARLAAGSLSRLDDLVQALDSIGAVDETTRPDGAA